ncbi:hypothetical protein CHLRE_12g515100v5 [Chlamydomonas reinhardtii]|uniref:Uncharacterized protein n=1 Tax=Chlamydomonas reinhardtii TaxID=3055 RepID=A8JHD5_CHLRE|nr:uncharacterized protein CHLRE_12g515100v5 [Chlamydomonas reinhardtii]PNW75155.1 hypothetical protein CHLRE_12g515100v5 [Chlamydomonas reinhardtii]|eukprot:XP_001702985.1 predicted protein [Chlamydomonas reinhardtii]
MAARQEQWDEEKAAGPQLQALPAAMSAASAEAAAAAAGAEALPPPMMPVNIQPSSYQTGCRIRGRYGDTACIERGRGMCDPANAEAVAAVRSAASVKARTTCSRGVCRKWQARAAVQRFRAKKKAQLAAAEVVDISSDSDSDVEIVG